MRSLIEFFTKGSKIIENFNKKIEFDLTSLIEKIISFLKDIYEKSELKAKLEIYYESLSSISEIDKIVKILIKIVKDIDIQRFFIKVINLIIENAENFLFATGSVDENLYRELEIRIEKAREINPKICRKIIKKYKDNYEKLISMGVISNSTLIFKDLKTIESQNNNKKGIIAKFSTLNYLRENYKSILNTLKFSNVNLTEVLVLSI